MNKKPVSSVAVIAHISDDHLSDGNTGTKVQGRLRVLQLVLQSLFLYNDMREIRLAIFDTGDAAEPAVLPWLSGYGFEALTMSSRSGFYTDDLAPQFRLWLRYRRDSDWNPKFCFRARRFLEACEASLRDAVQNNVDYLVVQEGDAILFGTDYVGRLVQALKNHPIACASSAGEVHTDLWVAHTRHALERFPSVFEAYAAPYSTERAFAHAFPDRASLNRVMVGQKILDQQVPQQRSPIKLPPRYYRKLPYSWITHITADDIEDIETYLLERTAARSETRPARQRLLPCWRDGGLWQPLLKWWRHWRRGQRDN